MPRLQSMPPRAVEAAVVKMAASHEGSETIAIMHAAVKYQAQNECLIPGEKMERESVKMGWRRHVSLARFLGHGWWPDRAWSASLAMRGARCQMGWATVACPSADVWLDPWPWGCG